jgi:hypothetical protein
MHVFLTTSDSRACPDGGECGAETDLGEWDIGEHSRLIFPPHTHCERRGRRFEHPEGTPLIIPPEVGPL